MSYLYVNDRTKIHYEVIGGDPDRPYLIFLHEGLGCVEMWRDFPERLCRRTKCPGLVYDRCGHGKSSPLEEKRDVDYLHDYALRELPLLIESIIPGKPYVLVGHSDGASISLICGAQGLPLLKGMAVEAPHVFVEPETIHGVRLADRVYDDEGPRGLLKYHGDKTHAMFKAWSGTWLGDRFRGWNIEPLLSSIACPVLVIQGSDDAYGTEKQVHAIASQVSGSIESHIIPDCGHTPHLEYPEKILDLMADFIRKLHG